MVRVWVGIVLGVVLFALLLPVQGLLEGLGFSPRDDAYLHAFALFALILLSVIALRREPARSREGNRIIKPRQDAEP
jgi:hypothetical protein